MNYISLKEATNYCSYSADYLKLRARQGKLKAVKIGRNWVTTQEWIEDYLKKDKQPVSFLPILLGLAVVLLIIGVFLNFDVFTTYFQWQTAHLSGILEVIPGKIIEIK